MVPKDVRLCSIPVSLRSPGGEGSIVTTTFYDDENYRIGAGFLYELLSLLLFVFRRLTQALGIAKPFRRFGNPLVGRGHDHAQRWLRQHALVPQGTSRLGVSRAILVFLRFFLGFRVPALVPCFRFGLVASLPPLGGFSVRPVLAVGFSFSCCPLASSIFSL